MSENNQSNQSKDKVPGDDRTMLAEARTRWAAQRTVLANERTFSAWLRTALAFVGAGLLVAELLGQGLIGWIPRLIGVLLIVAGTGATFLALWRLNQISKDLVEYGIPALPSWGANLLSGVVVVVSLLVLLFILLR